MRVFNLGDQVEVLDDVTKGRIISISDDEITIETEEGFPLKFYVDELVNVSNSEIRVSNHEIDMAKTEKVQPKRKNTIVPPKKERNTPKMEVDLHIHQLTPSSRGMSNHDMLNLQIDTAKRQLEFAIKKRIQKVVFIHGVGAGVLKEELHYLFGRYDNIKYYDAEYQKYGTGATEIYIYQG